MTAKTLELGLGGNRHSGRGIQTSDFKARHAAQALEDLSEQSGWRIIGRMHYFFVDEAYSRTGSRTKIAIASWGVEQTAWDRQVGRLHELYKTPVLESLSSMLDALDARASISTADLENALFRSGEIDGTDDIPAMARTDNIWSQCTIYGLSGLVTDLVKAGQEIGTVDIYFDSKSLKSEHFQAIAETLRKLIVPTTKGYASKLNSQLLTNFVVRRNERVEKPKAGQTPDRFQAGTWVADKICTNSDEMVRLNPKRVIHYDISDVVRRTARQFDGIPF